MLFYNLCHVIILELLILLFLACICSCVIEALIREEGIGHSRNFACTLHLTAINNLKITYWQIILVAAWGDLHQELPELSVYVPTVAKYHDIT